MEFHPTLSQLGLLQSAKTQVHQQLELLQLSQTSIEQLTLPTLLELLVPV
jgi:hypothetical protein